MALGKLVGSHQMAFRFQDLKPPIAVDLAYLLMTNKRAEHVLPHSTRLSGFHDQFIAQPRPRMLAAPPNLYERSLTANVFRDEPLPYH